MLGGTVCDFHGGKAPRVRRKAKLRVAMTTLPAKLVERGRRPNDVLLEALDRSAALMTAEGQPYYAEAIRQAATIAKMASEAGAWEPETKINDELRTEVNKVVLIGIQMAAAELELCPGCESKIRYGLYQGGATPLLHEAALRIDAAG